MSIVEHVLMTICAGAVMIGGVVFPQSRLNSRTAIATMYRTNKIRMSVVVDPLPEGRQAMASNTIETAANAMAIHHSTVADCDVP